jgi:hypothetical protein
MWVLVVIYSYAVTASAQIPTSEWTVRPTVTVQEFSTQNRCQAAKTKIDATMQQTVDQMEQALRDLRAVDGARKQHVFAHTVECLRK